jgi:hypothetical protein
MTPPSTVAAPASRRLRAFVVILARTSGAEALPAGLTAYLGLLILSSLIFGGNGMHPGELTALARASAGFRLSLLAAWLLISTPAARAILTTRSTFYLRCMPVPCWTVVPVLLAFMVLVELNWCWLWLAGEGPAGAGAIAVAIAGHAFLVSRPSRPSEIGGALAALALLLTTGRLGLWNAFGWPLAAFGVWRAWSSAPGRGQAGAWAVVRRGQPRLVALAAAHGATLFRRHRPLLLRWLWLTGAGGLTGVLAVRNNRMDGTPARTLWLTCVLPGLLFGAAGAVVPLARTAAKAGWMLLSCGISPGQRRLAFAVALLPPAASLGAATGALSVLGLSRSFSFGRAALPLLGLLAAACSVVVAATLGVGAIEGKGNDARRMLVRMAVTAGFLMLATWRFGCPGLLVATAASAALGLRPTSAREEAIRTVRIAQQAE